MQRGLSAKRSDADWGIVVLTFYRIKNGSIIETIPPTRSLRLSEPPPFAQGRHRKLDELTVIRLSLPWGGFFI